MKWHKEMLRGFRDNAAYEAGRYVILLIWPFALAGIYAGLSWLGTIHWNWRINAGLLLIAVIILCFTAWKLIRQRSPIPQARLSNLSLHLDEEIEKGAGRLERIEQRRKEAGPIRGFRVEALPPVPDTVNMTQHTWHEGANITFTGDAVFAVTNRLPAQGIDLVSFRLLSISPPMKSVKAWKPSTLDAQLKRIDFSADIPATVVAGKTNDVRLFKATRPFSVNSLKDITIEFYGKWPEGYYSVFHPGERHLLVVEVTGSGVGRTEETFALIFSTDKTEPVFTLTKVSEPKPEPTTEGPTLPSASEVIRHEAWERRQAEEGIMITLPRANEVKRPIHFYYDQLTTLIQTGQDMIEQLRGSTPPIPSDADVAEWARKLDDVATCCASVRERQLMKTGCHNEAYEYALVECCFDSPAEHSNRINTILGKIEAAKRIAQRICDEDKA